MKAHTTPPGSTRRSYPAAYNKSPLTDIGDGVGANTSSLTVVAKSFETHRDLTSFPFIRRAQPVSKMDLPGGTPASLMQIFNLRDFSLVSSLYFCRQEVRQSTHPRNSSEEPGQRLAKPLR